MTTIALPERSWSLDLRERQGLVPMHLSTRYELAAWEQANIARALAWLEQRRRRGSVLTSRFLRLLHKRMFDETWDHAGRYRRGKGERGVPAWTVSTRIEDVFARARGWIQMQAYPGDEIAIRFHHRMSELHPFERGNGRVLRLMTDCLVLELGYPAFTWGAKSRFSAAELRDRYVAALRIADNDNISVLLDFARS
jgi:Fic-DOC domain mobile mystery protein B